jgi:hypothetical protein
MEDSWERPEKYEMHVIAAIHQLHNAHVKAWIMKPWPFRRIGELPIMKAMVDDVFPLPLTVKMKSLGEK